MGLVKYILMCLTLYLNNFGGQPNLAHVLTMRMAVQAERLYSARAPAHLIVCEVITVTYRYYFVMTHARTTFPSDLVCRIVCIPTQTQPDGCVKT